MLSLVYNCVKFKRHKKTGGRVREIEIEREKGMKFKESRKPNDKKKEIISLPASNANKSTNQL